MNDIDYEDEEIQLRLKSCLAILRRRRLDLTAGEDISFEEKRQLVEDLHMHFKLVRINGVKHVVIYWAIYEQELTIGRYCDSVLPISETVGANSKCILRFDIRL